MFLQLTQLPLLVGQLSRDPVTAGLHGVGPAGAYLSCCDQSAAGNRDRPPEVRVDAFAAVVKAAQLLGSQLERVVGIVKVSE